MSLKNISKNKIYDGKRFLNKIIVAYLISILAIGTVLPIVNADPADPWWNAEWNYRKEIIIDHTKVDATLVNFPVLINLPSNASLATYAQSDGDDIVFTDAQGNKLNHEIELFTKATGQLIAWVNVTRLSSATDTKLYLYYGNSVCGNQQNQYGTWNAEYLMVQHMDEAGTIYDSTSHGYTGTNSGTTTELNGKIGACRYFDATGDLYDFGNAASLNPDMNSWTISLWTKITHVDAYRILSKWSNAGLVLLYNGGGTNKYNYIKVGDSVNTKKPYRYWDTSWSDGNWHYITAVINRNTNQIDVYLDGILHNGFANANLTGMASIASTANFYMYGGTNGRHDEFSISTRVRNASWIKTCYNNQNDPASFYSLGIQEQAPSGVNQPPVFETPTPANVSTNNPISLTWNIPINDPEGDLFSWTIQCSNGEFAGGNFAVNGTKTLEPDHLAYATTYKIWVNATDPAPAGSGQWTKRWYTFTTMSQSWVNRPPTFSNPSPANVSTAVNRYHATNVTVSDLDRNLTTVCFWYSTSNSPYSWIKAQQNNSVVANTTVRDINSSYSSGWNTPYWWKVTAYDGHVNSSMIYTFTTKSQSWSNRPPVFGTPSPTNGSTGNLLSLSWSIPINDPEGNTFIWTIQCNNGQTNNATGATNGTKTLALSGLAYSTTYKVWVNATDPIGSGLYTRKWYTFTTQQQNVPPNKPNKPSGNNSGKIKIVYTYTTNTTDPNGDHVYYMWDWGDRTPLTWTGPYNSGQTATASHVWSAKGSYSVKVKARDISGAESAWSDPLPITMPYSFNKLLLQFLDWLFERFPNAFPILRQMLGY